jgi:aspartate aminotransferase
MTTVRDESVRALALSRRGHAMPASPIRKLAPLAELAKSRGTKVYHLNIGQPDIETPACMLDRLKQIDDKVLEYSPSTGTPAFLNSLHHYCEHRLGLAVDTRQILATTGGSEAILFAFLAWLAQGRLSPPGLAQFIAVGVETLVEEYTRGIVRGVPAPARCALRRIALDSGLRAGKVRKALDEHLRAFASP